MTDEQIDAAVDWWANLLRDKEFSGLSAEERTNGENAGYQMAEMLAGGVAQKEAADISDEQVKLFKVALGHLIIDRLAKSKNGFFHLGVDYGPDMNLSQCLQFAGLPPHSSTILPWKTVMWMDDARGVEVGYGYGAEAKKIA